MKKDGKYGGPHGYVQTAGGPIMAGYKGPHISASPYDRHQFTQYAHHQYPSVDQVAMGYTTAGAGGVQYPGHQQQYGEFPQNVYPAGYYAAAAAGLPGLTLPHHATTTAAGQVYAAAVGETPTVTQAAYQSPQVVNQVDPEHHQSCSSSQGNSPDVQHLMMAHQAVNPTYLQVSRSGDSPQQQHVEVTSQAQQQHYQQQYQAASNQAM